MEQRGILLEINGRQAVVLTPQGEFLRIPANGAWQVGDEVTLPPPATVRTPRRGWLTYVAAAAAMVVLVCGATFYTNALPVEAAVATVTVDINPSLQLEVSARANVVGAQALNADGAELLQHLTYRKRPVDQVVADITDIAVKDGFLDPTAQDSLVLIAAEPKQGQDLPAAVATQVEEKARTAAMQVLTNHSKGKPVGAHVTVVRADDAVRRLADQEHISLGKAATARALEEMGIQVNPQDLSTKSVREVLREEAQREGLPPGEVVSQLEHQLHLLLGPGKGQGKADNGKGDSRKPDDGKPDDGKPDDGKPDRGKPGKGKPDDSNGDRGKPDNGSPRQGSRGNGGSGQSGQGQQDKGRDKDKNKKGPDQGQGSGRDGPGISVGGIHVGAGDGGNQGGGDGGRREGGDDGSNRGGGGGRDDRKPGKP